MSRGDSIRLLAYTDAPIVGGAELSLATLLAHLGPAYQVTVAGPHADVTGAIAARRPGSHAAATSERQGPAEQLVDHLRLVRRHRPHLLHVNLRTPYACTAALAAGALVPGVRTVAVEHLPLATSSRRNRALKRLLSRRLDAHVAVSDATARTVEAEAGLRPGSIRTIHNGVENGFAARRDAARETPLLTCVGRLERHKGFDVFLDALATVPDASATMIGDGPERAALAEQADRLGLRERVTFVGWRDDARTLIAASDALVLPSRNEGFPLVLLEAMLAGVPVVATDVGGVRECVEPGESGLLVRPDDADALAAALRRLVADRSLAARLADEARRRARERFGAPTMAAAYERLYAEVLAR